MKDGNFNRLARFVMEACTSFGTVLYLNYLYFFMQARDGWSDRENLALAAGLGLICAGASWLAGRVAHRFGYLNTLVWAFGLILSGLLFSIFFEGMSHAAPLFFISAAVLVCLGMSAVWPTLEAMVSEGAKAGQVSREVGIYNIVWAAAYATAFFCGGALIDQFGFAIIFRLPLILLVVAFLLAIWMKCQPGNFVETTPTLGDSEGEAGSVKSVNGSFLKMAWIANPFSYIAINTLIAVLPGVAHRLRLDTGAAGVLCSLWCFARLAAFLVLWRWTGWHYRFGWLVAALVLLIVSFAAILTMPWLAVVLPAQLAFGYATGLIYYSSLYYSMETGGAKSEYGGIHEAAIGLGNCAGPAVGALSMQMAGENPWSGAAGVTLLLGLGLVAVVRIRLQRGNQ